MSIDNDTTTARGGAPEPADPATAPAPGSDDPGAETATDEAILGELRRGGPDAGAAPSRGGLDKTLFVVAGVAAVAFVVWGFAGRDSLAAASSAAFAWVMENTGWGFVLIATLLVVFVLWLALGRFGRIPLGRDGDRPEFRTASWIAMMFSTGMGIGLMFYGVAEPLFHYVSPPPGTVDARTQEAIQTAMATSIFHWSIHPWAMFAAVGIAIAYSTFRMGRSQLISSVFVPLFGQRGADGWAGRAINILAIFATLFGTAASLGLGALQIASGLRQNGFAGDAALPVLIGIVALLTACFVASAVSGIARGIQWLSNTNMVLAIVLALLVFVAGPTLFILNLVPAAVGDYFRDLPTMALRTEASGGEAMREWMSGWTVFYWAWWMSWTPFVGMFIARISRGRTIRQFVTGVLLVPSLASVVWFGIFGGAAFRVQAQADASPSPDDGLVATVDGQPSIDFEGALFDLLQALPLPGGLALATGILAMVLVAIFFVTGADSASIVMGTLSSKGSLEPRRPVLIFWGTLAGAVAGVMLVAGGDEPGAALGALQQLTIVAALPFAAVVLLMCAALVRDLRRDPLMLRRRLADNVVERAIREGVDAHRGGRFGLITRHECGDDCPDGDCPGPSDDAGHDAPARALDGTAVAVVQETTAVAVVRDDAAGGGPGRPATPDAAAAPRTPTT